MWNLTDKEKETFARCFEVHGGGCFGWAFAHVDPAKSLIEVEEKILEFLEEHFDSEVTLCPVCDHPTEEVKELIEHSMVYGRIYYCHLCNKDYIIMNKNREFYIGCKWIWKDFENVPIKKVHRSLWTTESKVSLLETFHKYNFGWGESYGRIFGMCLKSDNEELLGYAKKLLAILAEEQEISWST